MQRRYYAVLSSLVVVSVIGLAPLRAADPATPNAESTGYAEDNSRMNAYDREAGRTTADQAKNNKTDLEIMSQIRRSIVEDKSLSTYAHNVKVVAQQGHVTLKGTVHTEDEKTKIGEKAANIVGTEHVDNLIAVKGS